MCIIIQLTFIQFFARFSRVNLSVFTISNLLKHFSIARKYTHIHNTHLFDTNKYKKKSILNNRQPSIKRYSMIDLINHRFSVLALASLERKVLCHSLCSYLMIHSRQKNSSKTSDVHGFFFPCRNTVCPIRNTS